MCLSSVALILFSTVCFAQCPPDIKATLPPNEETPDYAYQPPPPNAFNILHRYRFVPPAPFAPPYPTVLMLPPDLFTAEYGDRGVASELWATYDLQQAGFLVFQVDHRLAPQNTLPGQATDGGPPFQTDDVKRHILAALADTTNCNGSIYLVGGSAGGTLALWCALDPATGSVTGWSENKRSHIKAVVSLSGPADFCDLDSNPGDIPSTALAKFKNVIDNYVRLPDGTDCSGDPNGNLMHASPKWLVTNGATSSPPPIRLYSTQGDTVPFSQGQNMRDALKTKFGFSFDVTWYVMTYQYSDPNHHAYTYWHSTNDADNSDGRCVSQQVIDFLKANP